MKLLIVIACFFLPLSTAYSTNHCTDLIGTWEGGRHASTEKKRDVQVVFTNIEKDGHFKGYYLFMDSPKNTINFSGQCAVADGDFEQLTFKPVPPHFNVCMGAYNKKKELWLGCPFIEIHGIYHKK